MCAAYLVQNLVFRVLQIDHCLSIRQTIGSLGSRPCPGPRVGISLHSNILASRARGSNGIDGCLVEISYKLTRLVVKFIVRVEDNPRIRLELLGNVGPKLT